jgi:hypothetical protein
MKFFLKAIKYTLMAVVTFSFYYFDLGADKNASYVIYVITFSLWALAETR